MTQNPCLVLDQDEEFDFCANKKLLHRFVSCKSQHPIPLDRN